MNGNRQAKLERATSGYVLLENIVLREGKVSSILHPYLIWRIHLSGPHSRPFILYPFSVFYNAYETFLSGCKYIIIGFCYTQSCKLLKKNSTLLAELKVENAD